mgnify:CR=1 FL=1
MPGCGAVHKFHARKSGDVGKNEVFGILRKRLVERDSAHPFVVHRYAVNDGVMSDSAERFPVRQLERVTDVGVIERLCVGAVGRLLLHDAGVRVLAGDDRLIIAVDVRKVVSLTVEHTVFEPEKPLHGREVGRIGVGRHVMSFGRNDLQSGDDHILAAVADDTHAGLAVDRDVVEADEFDKGERMLLNFGHTLGHSI